MELEELLYVGRLDDELFTGRELTACEPFPFEFAEGLRVVALLLLPELAGRVDELFTGRVLTACEPFELVEGLRVDAPVYALPYVLPEADDEEAEVVDAPEWVEVASPERPPERVE